MRNKGIKGALRALTAAVTQLVGLQTPAEFIRMLRIGETYELDEYTVRRRTVSEFVLYSNSNLTRTLAIGTITDVLHELRMRGAL